MENVYIHLFLLCFLVVLMVCLTVPVTAVTYIESMGIDIHKKVGGIWTKYKQNANLGNSYSNNKNLHKANSVVSHYLNTYRTFTSNTDWNMTRNQTKSSHM